MSDNLKKTDSACERIEIDASLNGEKKQQDSVNVDSSIPHSDSALDSSLSTNNKEKVK
jgi:hypothetical protein